MVTRLRLSREQLAEVFADHQQIRQFEKLFSIGEDVDNSSIVQLAELLVSSMAQIEDLSARITELEKQDAERVADVQSSVNYLQLTDSPSANEQYRIKWNDPSYNAGFANAVNYRMGLMDFAYCGNATGVTIPAGSPVYISSASGGYVNVSLASNPFIQNYLGITVQAIDNLKRGFVAVNGMAEGIDASGTPFGEVWAAGDVLYLGNTAGTLTKVKPVGPKVNNAIGVVTSTTSIQVQQTRSIGVNELYDVDPAGGTNGDLLIFDSAFGRFRYNKLTAGTSIKITNGAGTITIAGDNLTNNQAGSLISSSVALSNGAGAALGTLTNAPAAGPPTKWIPVSDNGTTRYFPAW
jgi:hypothetical protein